MKETLLILMLSVFTVCAQTAGVFVPVKATGNPSYEIVGKGIKGNSNPFVKGKTYTFNKTSYAVVTTNDAVTLRFSNGLIANIRTNSNFTINDFQQELLNPTGEPSKAKFGSHVLTTTLLDGEGVFVFDGGDSNSMASVSTPLVDIELLKGKFRFQCSEKGVVVYVLEGSLRYHGERGRNDVVEAGKAVVAAPIQFQTKMIDDKVFLNTKKIKTDEHARLLNDAKSVESSTPQVVFAVVNGALLGVNID